MSQDTNDKSPFGGSNSGNHWPWSFSLFGGALILLLLSFAVYRHYTLGAPVGFDDPLEQPAAPIDTSKANEATQLQ
jgi:hypothetical protein